MAVVQDETRGRVHGGPDVLIVFDAEELAALPICEDPQAARPAAVGMRDVEDASVGQARRVVDVGCLSTVGTKNLLEVAASGGNAQDAAVARAQDDRPIRAPGCGR